MPWRHDLWLRPGERSVVDDAALHACHEVGDDRPAGHSLDDDSMEVFAAADASCGDVAGVIH